jgi:hypothetical protein
MKQFYILFLIIISVVSIFCIGLYNKNTTVIEGKGRKKFGQTKFGKFVRRMKKTISKTLGLNKIGQQKRRNARKNKARNNRIKKYVFKLNSLYDYSVSITPIDYLQTLLDDFKKLYVDNHNTVYRIWSNLKIETRSYLKQKYIRFNQLKQKILFDNNNINIRKKGNTIIQNNSMISISSTETFTLPPNEVISNDEKSNTNNNEIQNEVVSTNSDFSVGLVSAATNFINQVSSTEKVNEYFVDFLGNIDNGDVVAYYVNVYNNYEHSANYTNNDVIEQIFKSYEIFFDTQLYEIQKTIEKIKQNKNVNNGETLYYINTKLEYFYKILNTIEQKTLYGKQLIS